MEIEILDEDENPMLHRTDVRFGLRHEEATPSRLQVRDSLAAKLDKDSDEVVVRTLDTKYGMRETIGDAKVYESPDDARDVEQDHMLDRNKIEAEVEDADGEVENGAGDDEAEEDEAEEVEAEDDLEAEEDEAEEVEAEDDLEAEEDEVEEVETEDDPEAEDDLEAEDTQADEDDDE